MVQVSPLSYKDIKKIVLSRIRSRVWPPGSYLPTETEIALEFGSTRTTINRALRELSAEGYIERKRKAGTRVLQHPKRTAKFTIPTVRSEVETTGKAYRFSILSNQTIIAPNWLVDKLGLEPNQHVIKIITVHYADNRPFSYEDRWINLSVVPNATKTDFSKINPNEWLIENVPLTDVQFIVSAQAASTQAAEYLDIAKETPILVAERMTWLDGLPVTWASLYYEPSYKMKSRQ